MDCAYFAADQCRSCTLLPMPYPDQVAAKVAAVAATLPTMRWLPPVTGPEQGFRNKAKMVLGGTVAEPLLGIQGQDLRHCGLHEPAVAAALPHVADFVTRASLTPYDVSARRGELKHVLVTGSPAGRLMVRFVSRSQEPVSRIRKHLPALLEAVPAIDVVSVNLQPEHKAVLEGEREIVLTGQQTLEMRVNDVDLRLRPQSFFQTNTVVAAALYQQARGWADDIGPRTVWDLYCGVGGFARHLATPGRDVTGVEISPEAVEAANLDATEQVRFEVGDAIDWVRQRQVPAVPDLIVVNPPRRGIGDLASHLEASDVRDVIYSSCNADSLARDLQRMPSLAPVRGRLLDMFPQTEHYEVLVHLRRR